LAGSLLLAGLPAVAPAQGHGPIYGLSTPTLGAGGWSLDLGTMGRRTPSGEWMAMFRPMLSYGITEDVQLSVSVPVPLRTPAAPRPERVATRMPATRDVEVLGAWRFHRSAPSVGSRFETTLYAGLDVPTDEARRGAETAPGLVGALVTGYASRSVYVWVGGLGRRYRSAGPVGGDRPGDLAMASLVVGYRPPAFRHDYPRPDWRVFLEVVGEVSGRDRVGGVRQPDTGGRQLYVGPTLLGLFGSWGVSGGPLFPVYRRLNGGRRGDSVRLAFDLIFWF